MGKKDFEQLYEDTVNLCERLNYERADKRFYVEYDRVNRKYYLQVFVDAKNLDGSFNIGTINKYSKLLGTSKVTPDIYNVSFKKRMSLKKIYKILERQ